MEKFLIVLAGILISLTSPALGEVIGESSQVEHQPTAQPATTASANQFICPYSAKRINSTA